MSRPSGPPASPPENNEGVHRRHCNQGEWVGQCKYGPESDCPVFRSSGPPAPPTLTEAMVADALADCDFTGGPADPWPEAKSLHRHLLAALSTPPAAPLDRLTKEEAWALLSEERLARAICAARNPKADPNDPDMFVDHECQDIAVHSRTWFLAALGVGAESKGEHQYDDNHAESCNKCAAIEKAGQP